MDLSSINVHEYDPPHYEIAGIFVGVPDSFYSKYSERYGTSVIRYSYNEKKAYSQSINGQWNEIETDRKTQISMRGMAIADALFYAAYGMNFFD